VKAFLDTGFLLTILTHRSGADEAWGLLKQCEIPAIISSLQLFFVRHGLNKPLLNPNEVDETQQISVRALKLLNWVIQQEIIQPAEIDYQEAVAVAESWASKLRTPMPSLLLLWPACTAVSGVEAFFSFDPRNRALAKRVGLKTLPEKL
jgi:hypothetical protein